MDWATATGIHYSTTVGIYWLQVSVRRKEERWVCDMNRLTNTCIFHCLRPRRSDKIWGLRHSWSEPQKGLPPPPPPSTPRPPTAKWKDRGGWNAVRYSGKRQDGRERSRSFSHFGAQEPADEQQQVQEEHFCIWSCLCRMKHTDQTEEVLTEDQILIKNPS